MSEIIQNFEENKFVILKDVLTKQQCERLTKYLFDQFNAGNLKKDNQCKLSDAVYGDPVLEDVLQVAADPISKMIGKKLLPTYCYARIYRPGEVLDAHVDRPACEISATITLGVSGKKVWPIYFDNGKKEVKTILPVGTAAIYRGMEVVHWRNKFEGEWQVQMFLHYVDADGPHKEEFMDKRKKFGTKKDEAIVVKPQTTHVQTTVWPFKLDQTEPYAFWKAVFTKEECEKIITLGAQQAPQSGVVRVGDKKWDIEKSIRKSEVAWLHPTQDTEWIYRKLTDIVTSLNDRFFQFDLFGFTESLQFTKYTAPGGNYGKHIDSGVGIPVRKLSLVVQLTDPKEYEGGNLALHFNDDPTVMDRDQGDLFLFPSYTLHEVTALSKGTRYSLVAWITGKPFK